MMTSWVASPKVRGRLLEHEPLADYTVWRVGGPAEMVFIPADLSDLAEFLQHLPLHVPVHWLGSGSHVLIRDGGVDGVVIVMQGALNHLSLLQPHIVRAESGVTCAQLARYTARMGLAGLEFMAAMPGTVGGALAMNTGCFGSETWQHVHSVETLNHAGQIQLRSRADFAINHHQVKGPNSEWFVAGHFNLVQEDKTQLLSHIRHLLKKRSASQPMGSCAAIFRNPTGHYAAHLIEKCGLKKMTIGGAYVSEKHANFIINDGTATAADIESLMEHIFLAVIQKFEVRLVPEIRIIGKVLS